MNDSYYWLRLAANSAFPHPASFERQWRRELLRATIDLPFCDHLARLVDRLNDQYKARQQAAIDNSADAIGRTNAALEASLDDLALILERGTGSLH